MPIDHLTAFLGWCSVINIGILAITSIVIVLFKRPIAHIHGSMMELSRSNLNHLYFQYLAFYKVSIFIFNLVPYIALKIVAHG